MVDRGHLDYASSLYGELRHYKQVLEWLPQAKISAFTLRLESADPEADATMPEFTVAAAGIAYPPQMLTAIKTQVQERIDHINRQLDDMGVASGNDREGGEPVSAQSGNRRAGA